MLENSHTKQTVSKVDIAQISFGSRKYSPTAPSDMEPLLCYSTHTNIVYRNFMMKN